MRHAFVKGCCTVAFIAGLFAPAKSIAQSNAAGMSFKWGEEYELPKRFEDLGFIGNSTDGYLQIGHRDHEALSFQKFDTKLHFTGEQETDISNLPRDYTNEFFTQLGNKYYWFFSTYEKSEDAESLYAQEVDLKTGTVKGAARRILTTSKLTGTLEMHSLFSAKLTDKWNFYFSFDKKKLMIEYRKKAERGDDNRNSIFGFNVFDESLTKLWGREVRMPFEERRGSGNGDYQVDSRGNIYTVVKVYDDERGDRRHPNYRFEVLRFSKDDVAIKHIPFRFTDKFVSTATITEDPTGAIIVAGYYSNLRNSESSDGAFLLKLDESTGELANVKKGTYAFPVDVLRQFESARTRRRLERREEKDKDVEAPHLVLRDVVNNPDGSIQIFGEEYYVQVVTTYTGRSTHTTYIYHYDDIMAMTLNADGTLRWVRKIPKAQSNSGSPGGEMVYKEYTFGTDTYFFFMDRESNLELDPDHAPDVHNERARGILAAVKIDKDGKMQKQMVYDGREEKVRLTPTDFDEVGNNQLIVRGRARRRESQAALITFH